MDDSERGKLWQAKIQVYAEAGTELYNALQKIKILGLRKVSPEDVWNVRSVAEQLSVDLYFEAKKLAKLIKERDKDKIGEICDFNENVTALL